VTNLALLLVLIAGATLVAMIAATVAILAVAVRYVLDERRERVRVQRRARRAAQAYGLALVPPRDELADRRAARRNRGRVA
jgi:hypothetical protein